MIDVPYHYAIIDNKNNYSYKLYSGYKKNDVLLIFQNSLINNKLEDACKWMVELNISGKNDEIWHEIIYILTNYINILNINIFDYIYKKLKYFYEIYNKLNKKQKIHIRNNQEIRNLLTDIIAIITLSKKKNIFNSKILPKIKIEDFEKKKINKILKSNNLDLIIEITNNQDDNHIKIAMNEIAFNLRVTKNYHKLLYWYFWIKKNISEKKKRNLNIIFKTREISNINIKYKADWIWFLWEVLIRETNFRDDNNKNLIKILYFFYKFNYQSKLKKKKEPIILFVFYILTNNINLNKNLFNNNVLRLRAIANINYLYITDKNSIEEEIRKKIYKSNLELFTKKKEIKKKIINDHKKEDNLSYLNDLLLFKKK